MCYPTALVPRYALHFFFAKQKTTARTAVYHIMTVYYLALILKLFIMTKVIFYAEMHTTNAKYGKAYLLNKISSDKKLTELVLPSAFWPISQLEADVINLKHKKDYALVECKVPEWLWDAKLKDANNAFKPKISDSFHQLTLQMADTDNVTLPPEKEKVRDIINEGLE